MDWQPIETAPIVPQKSAEPMLLFCPGISSWNRYNDASYIVVGAWNGGGWYSDIGDIEGGYESTGDYFVREPLHPTHWMPLPPPPSKPQGE